MSRRESRTPPTATRPEVVSCPTGGVAGIAVVDQVHSPEVMMTTTESLQLLDVMRRIFRLNASRFHPAAVNDQEVQDAERSMPGVLELLLLDRARGLRFLSVPLFTANTAAVPPPGCAPDALILMPRVTKPMTAVEKI